MNTRTVFLLVAALLASLSLDAKGANPNIVFILADDLGYGDVGVFNSRSKIPTPHLDELAAQGMRFTDAHSGAAVCTPTRYGVVTGRYSWRTRLKRGVLGGYSRPLINEERLTVAKLLRQHGYQTGCVGKWHLGMDIPRQGDDSKQVDYNGQIRVNPNTYGFDYFYGVTASLDMPPYVYVENDRFTKPASERFEGSRFPAFIRAGEMAPGFEHAKTLRHLTEKAVGFINNAVTEERPFFLYFAMTAPHKPVLPEKSFRGRTELGPYGDFIVQTDWAIGRIDQALQKQGLEENTLLMVSSDNGSFMYELEPDASGHTDDPTVQGYRPSVHRANHVFRGTKADVWEGGHHVPFVARWPDKVKAESKCAEPICLTDLMATCADVAGLELPDNAGEDSYSFLPLLQGKDQANPRPPVIHHSANGTFAIREGKWKLIFGKGSGGRGNPRSRPWSEPYQLYDLENDINESRNLVDEHPGVVQRLTRAFEDIHGPIRAR